MRKQRGVEGGIAHKAVAILGLDSHLGLTSNGKIFAQEIWRGQGLDRGRDRGELVEEEKIRKSIFLN